MSPRITHDYDVVALDWSGIPVSLAVASGNDHIAKQIKESGAFYEAELLRSLAPLIDASDTVVDVGANIGNHTVFFARVCGASVLAFEPNRVARELLADNLKRNGIEDRVAVYGTAVGARAGRARMSHADGNNLGATAYAEDPAGDHEQVRLDDAVKGEVRLLKVDVEGADYAVLEGASQLIERCRPYIVCEAASTEEFERIQHLMSGWDYLAAGCFNATATYLFMPARSAEEREKFIVRESQELIRTQVMVREKGRLLSSVKHTLDKLAFEHRKLAGAFDGGAGGSVGLVGQVAQLEERLSSAINLAGEANSRLNHVQTVISDNLARTADGMRLAADHSREVSVFREASKELRSTVESVEQATRELAQRIGDLEGLAPMLSELESRLMGKFTPLIESGSELAAKVRSNTEQLVRIEENSSSKQDVGRALGKVEECRAHLESTIRGLELEVAAKLGSQRSELRSRAFRDAQIEAILERVSVLERTLKKERGTYRQGMDANQWKETVDARIEKLLLSNARLRSRFDSKFAAVKARVEDMEERHRQLLSGTVFSTLRWVKKLLAAVLGTKLSSTQEDISTTVEAEQNSKKASAPARVTPPAPELTLAPAVIRNVPYMRRPSSKLNLEFMECALPKDVLVSVIMTTYNTEGLVEGAIRSILDQTYENFELIVVDDCSTDGTRKVVERLGNADKRIRLVCFGANRGTYWCKNFGITQAKGSVITFMDSDDVSLPTRVEKQLAALRGKGRAVTTCLHERYDEAGGLVLVNGKARRPAYISQMMRRGVFEQVGFFDSVRTSADDEMLRRIKRVFGDRSHECVQEVLYRALVRSASLTQDPTNRGIANLAGGLALPRKAYSEAVDSWHRSLAKLKYHPYVPYPVVRRPFSVHEKLRVIPDQDQDDAISACVASYPGRREQLKVAVRSLINQVDQIYVYLNGYRSVPNYLVHPRITVYIGGEDLRDNGKFYFMDQVESGYVITFDDDIVYPSDYVQRLIQRIEIYGRKAAVGVHGTIFAKPFRSYFGDRTLYHFKHALPRDEVVNQLGTGTLAFHTQLWRPSNKLFLSQGMVDAWLAVEAKRRSIPLIAVQRKKGWLVPLDEPKGESESLFGEFKNKDEQQTALIAAESPWSERLPPDLRTYLHLKAERFGTAFAAQVVSLTEKAGESLPAVMLVPEKESSAVASVGAIDTRPSRSAGRTTEGYRRAEFSLAVVGRCDRARWKKGGILKSTHLTAAMLRPLGVQVHLVDIETGDPRGLNGSDAEIVMIYPGDPERPDFKDVISLVDHHAALGRTVLVNLSLNGRPSRKTYICKQMSAWRSRFGRRVRLMTFSDRVEDDPALAAVADLMVAIPKTLEHHDSELLPFHERDGIFLGDFGKLCDETLLAWPAEDVISRLRVAIPEARLFCVRQYKPKRHKDLGIEVLPFLSEDYAGVLSKSRLMLSLVKYATFEMVPMELAAMGVPVLHPKMDNSLSDYLGLAAVEANSLEYLVETAEVLYRDGEVWTGLSTAGAKVAAGLEWPNMASQMYMRLLALSRDSGSPPDRELNSLSSLRD